MYKVRIYLTPTQLSDMIKSIEAMKDPDVSQIFRTLWSKNAFLLGAVSLPEDRRYVPWGESKPLFLKGRGNLRSIPCTWVFFVPCTSNQLRSTTYCSHRYSIKLRTALGKKSVYVYDLTEYNYCFPKQDYMKFITHRQLQIVFSPSPCSIIPGLTFAESFPPMSQILNFGI